MKKLFLKITKDKKEVKLKPEQDILNLAGTIKPNKISTLKTRELFEKNYERI